MNKTVNRLIQQYKEYVEVADKISKLKGELLRCKVSNRKNEFNLLSLEIKQNESLLNRISDEMSFKDPVVWILYKYFAYKGTVKNIDTMYDLMQHCLPEGYVCTKRLKYLSRYLDLDKIKKNSRLNRVVNMPEILKLITDSDFMSGWQKYEYYIKGGKIAKWENFK